MDISIDKVMTIMLSLLGAGFTFLWGQKSKEHGDLWKEINGIKTMLATDYVTKEDLQTFLETMNQRLDRLEGKMDQLLIALMHNRGQIK